MGSSDPSARLLAIALAAGLPLACFVATASPYGYWHDAGEFVAQAATLGIAHPPGHPLAGIIHGAFALLPIGSIALRVALASALLTSIAAAFLYLAIERTIRAQGIAAARIYIPVALGATWLVVGSVGWWLQAVRPEVYALQAALSCIVLERVIALEAAWPTLDIRPIHVAAFALGLSLANHHFLGFLLLPALAPTVARVYRARGFRPVLTAIAFGALGLSAYVYLPVRADAGAALNLGDPDDLGRLYWVVSAQAFQGSALITPQPLGERFADVLVQLIENLHAIPVLMALAGAYTLLRNRGSRRLGFVWLAVLLFFCLARGWLGFIRSNPDALGYLMAAFGAVGALAAAFVAQVLVSFGRADRDPPARTSVVLALVVAALGLAQIHRSVDRASLATFAATDAFEEIGRRTLPPRAVVFAFNPQTIFRMWGGEAAEQMRPDVTVVAMPFLTYPNFVNALAEGESELEDVLRGRVLSGSLRLGDLQSLSARRPVLVELDPRISPELYGTLVPHGLFHQALPDRAYDDDRQQGSRRSERAWDHLLPLLGRDAEELETSRQLVWHLYHRALYYAAAGEWDRAQKALGGAETINPLPAELARLRDAVDAAAADPDATGIDVSPYLLHL